MKNLIAYVFIVLCLFSMAACGQQNGSAENVQERIMNKLFVYEKEGCGGDFTIQINDDGTFSYYEGPLSSYIGIGIWELEGDILTLSDDEKIGDPFVNHFQIRGDDLVFLSEDSSNFIYVEVADGERFTSAPAAS